MNCTQEQKNSDHKYFKILYIIYMYTCTANDGKLGKQVHVQM